VNKIIAESKIRGLRSDACALSRTNRSGIIRRHGQSAEEREEEKEKANAERKAKNKAKNKKRKKRRIVQHEGDFSEFSTLLVKSTSSSLDDPSVYVKRILRVRKSKSTVISRENDNNIAGYRAKEENSQETTARTFSIVLIVRLPRYIEKRKSIHRANLRIATANKTDSQTFSTRPKSRSEDDDMDFLPEPENKTRNARRRKKSLARNARNLRRVSTRVHPLQRSETLLFPIM